jgi:hypothetical protein
MYYTSRLKELDKNVSLRGAVALPSGLIICSQSPSYLAENASKSSQADKGRYREKKELHKNLSIKVERNGLHTSNTTVRNSSERNP